MAKDSLQGLTWVQLIIVAAVAIACAGGERAHPQAAGQQRSTKILAPGVRFRDCRQCPQMIVVPPGRFIMGAPVEGSGSERYAPHPVSVPQAFAAGVYDVTVAEYGQFVRETGHASEPGCNFFDGQRRWTLDPKLTWRSPGFQQMPSDPVVCVSWNDAKAYAGWLNRKVATDRSQAADGHYRLLTEAEWEYAARAGSCGLYYWGAEPSHNHANYGLEQCYPCGGGKEGKDQWFYTSPVGSFTPNAFGLYDMLGNVWQWTEDCMHFSFAGAPADGSAWTSGECHDRVLRGGSWLDPSKFVAVHIRNPWPPDDRNYANGFRVARSLD